MVFLVVAIFLFAAGVASIAVGFAIAWRARQIIRRRALIDGSDLFEWDDKIVPFWGRLVLAGVALCGLAAAAYSKVPEPLDLANAMPSRDWHIVLYSCGAGSARHHQMVDYVTRKQGYRDIVSRERSGRTDNLAATSTVLYYGDTAREAAAFASALGKALNTSFSTDAGAGKGHVVRRSDQSLIVNLIEPACEQRSGLFGWL